LFSPAFSLFYHDFFMMSIAFLKETDDKKRLSLKKSERRRNIDN